jgi:hypothetical protein
VVVKREGSVGAQVKVEKSANGKKGSAAARKARKKKRAAEEAAKQSSTIQPITSAPRTTVEVKKEPGLPPSDTDSLSSASQPPKQGKTRRSGQRNRARRDRAEVRGMLDPSSEVSPASTPAKLARNITPTSSSMSGSEVSYDSEDEEDDSEVDAMSALGEGSVEGTPARRVKIERSLISRDDASSSIDRSVGICVGGMRY